MPWEVIYAAVILVQVSQCVVVTVVVVNITISSSADVYLESWVNSNWINSVFRKKP